MPGGGGAVGIVAAAFFRLRRWAKTQAWKRKVQALEADPSGGVGMQMGGEVTVLLGWIWLGTEEPVAGLPSSRAAVPSTACAA
jgi:hypothetical protein